MPSKIEITPKAIILTILIGFGLWLVVQIREIIELLFIAVILMSALRPAVDYLEKLRIPRPLAIFLLYAVIISLLSSFVTIIFPPLLSESIRLLTHLPQYFQKVAPFVNINSDTFVQQIAPLTQNVARVTVGVFSNVITIFTLAVFTFYFLLERNNLREFLKMFIGPELGQKTVEIVKKAEVRLGSWVRGQLLLGLIIGMTTYLGLTFLGISFVLPLALFAGILEMVPIIGPIISAIPSVLVALTVSPGLALAVVALYFVIQQLENNIVVPMVMQKAVGLPPLASLLALMIGGKLGGTVGIILAVPVLLVIQTVIGELFVKSKS